MPEHGLFFDTVTLSNFASANRVDLLVSRYGRRALVTPEVLDEVADGFVAGYVHLATVETALASRQLGNAEPLSLDEREIYRELLRIVSPGEASCIAGAKSRGGIVVTDDKTARGCCTERGVDFTGTIGILRACVLDTTLSSSDADLILQKMIDDGFYSPVTTISGLV